MAGQKKSNKGTGGPHGSYLTRKENQRARLDKAFNHQSKKPKAPKPKKGE
jgi:hypothetical protein